MRTTAPVTAMQMQEPTPIPQDEHTMYTKEGSVSETSTAQQQNGLRRFSNPKTSTPAQSPAAKEVRFAPAAQATSSANARPAKMGDKRNPPKKKNTGLSFQRGRQDKHVAEKSQAQDVCYRCGKKGHHACNCPHMDSFERGVKAGMMAQAMGAMQGQVQDDGDEESTSEGEGSTSEDEAADGEPQAQYLAMGLHKDEVEPPQQQAQRMASSGSHSMFLCAHANAGNGA